jgi:hypothetical protein
VPAPAEAFDDRRTRDRALRFVGCFIFLSVSQQGAIVLAKRSKHRPGKPQPTPAPSRGAATVTVRRRPDGTWELMHPRCKIEREADLREAEAMVAAGEHEIARDELRWLLEGCSDNIAAHELLGELALYEENIPLARGHFGYAYQLGMKAIRAAGSPAPLAFELAANQAFFSAGKGLVHCLLNLDKRDVAAEVVDFLVQCDPRDPLHLRRLLEDA